MNPQIDIDDVIEHFTLLPPEIDFLGSNNPHNHLGKALLLKFCQCHGRFPESDSEFTAATIEYVARQLSIKSEAIRGYNWSGRTIKEHRRQIREWLGFHPATLTDQEALQAWLMQEVLPHEHRPVYLEQLAYQRLRDIHVEPPTQGRMNRLITAAVYQHEQSFFNSTAERLPEEVKANLLRLIHAKADLSESIDLGETIDDAPSSYPIHDLKSGPGDAKVANIKKVADRLKFLHQIGLPKDIFQDIPLRFLRQYQQQTAVESISHLQRRHENPQTYALLASFCWVRHRPVGGFVHPNSQAYQSACGTASRKRTMGRIYSGRREATIAVPVGRSHVGSPRGHYP